MDLYLPVEPATLGGLAAVGAKLDEEYTLIGRVNEAAAARVPGPGLTLTVSEAVTESLGVVLDTTVGK